MNHSLTAGLILLGAGVMIYATMRTRSILQVLQGTLLENRWQRMFALMSIFSLGYLGAAVLVLTDKLGILGLLVGVIFLLGALFVLLVVQAGYQTIAESEANGQALKEAHDQAVQAFQYKSEILARTSHELRTPLNAILGYTDMLREEVYGALNEQQAQITARISANTQRLIANINSLIDQADMESGQFKLKANPFSPRQLARETAGILHPLSDVKNLAFTSVCSPDLPEMMIGDYARLKEILVNLGENAIKFTEQGAVRMEILTGSQPGTWELLVSDTGIGISKAEQQNIFNSFVQAENVKTRRYQGIGLGLTIVKELTHRMGGTVTLTSEAGQGSTFRVQLPMLPYKDIR
jgi:signal transduction histidine kinase